MNSRSRVGALDKGSAVRRLNCRPGVCSRANEFRSSFGSTFVRSTRAVSPTKIDLTCVVLPRQAGGFRNNFASAAGKGFAETGVNSWANSTQ